jgi:hypothetical protein
MTNKVTVKESIFINKSRETVWDYTQNYDNRPGWDASIISSETLQETPNLIVRVKSPGNIYFNFEYKLSERPHKTSLAMLESSSALIIGGGGSWVYDEKDNGTFWTQTNTIVFKDNAVFRFLNPALKFFLQYSTKKAMVKAKKIMEKT